MKKTVGITKYEIHWQILRSSLKGRFNDDLQYKLERAYSYYKDKPSYDRHERVSNWIEGLHKGFKDNYKRDLLIDLASKLDFHDLSKYQESINKDSDFGVYNIDQLKFLWKDLLKTNLSWLNKGYFHNGLNIFMDKLSKYIDVDKDLLEISREKSKYLKNRHKFFF